MLICTMSLSARRAWIEINGDDQLIKSSIVALRKESVDRNCDLEPIKNPEAVALRKESVDRNSIALASIKVSTCRSPQGERG